jgi:hypothetical protein
MSEDDRKSGKPLDMAAVVNAIVSPPKETPLVVDPAEFVALRALVTAILAAMALS